MIKIEANIKIVGDTDSISNMYGSSSDKKNNVSSGLAGVFEHENSTKKLFLLSGNNVDGSRLLDNCVYSEQEIPYYISQNKYSNSTQQSAEYGSGYQIINTGGSDSYIVIYVKRTSGSTATSAPITIVFDEKNNQYATRMSIAGVGFVTNDSPVFSTNIPIGSTPSEIRIYSWSKPNSPVVITGMYESLIYKIGQNKIISCDFELVGKPTTELPSFGIVSNNGSIECVDFDGELFNYIIDGKFNDKKEVDYIIYNTHNNTRKKISTFIIDTIDYDEDSKVSNISVFDELVFWQDIRDVRVYLESNKTMLYVYNTLKNLTPSRYVFAELNSDIEDYLSRISLKYFFLKTDTLWRQWQKFCEATGLYLYINKENKITLASEFSLEAEL